MNNMIEFMKDMGVVVLICFLFFIVIASGISAVAAAIQGEWSTAAVSALVCGAAYVTFTMALEM